MSDILSTANVAGLIGISEGTLRYWRYMDEGPKSFRLGRHVKYRRMDVDAWLESQVASTSRGGQSNALQPLSRCPEGDEWRVPGDDTGEIVVIRPVTVTPPIHKATGRLR